MFVHNIQDALSFLLSHKLQSSAKASTLEGSLLPSRSYPVSVKMGTWCATVPPSNTQILQQKVLWRPPVTRYNLYWLLVVNWLRVAAATLLAQDFL